MKIGDRVRMTDNFKRNNPNSEDHINEFGSCSGIVVDYSEDNPYGDIDVRWLPSRLKYGYTIDSLELDYQYYRDKNIDIICRGLEEKDHLS